LRQPLPKIAELLEDAEEDLPGFYCFPAAHSLETILNDYKKDNSTEGVRELTEA
jgi:hypothetical protein